MIKTALSFSGGKDSCFALYKLRKQGIHVVCLITTIWKESGKTVAHEEKKESVQKQADAIGIPLEFIVTDFNSYTDDFESKLQELKTTYHLDAVAFGDIYLKGHREWGEKLAKASGLKALYPLWTSQEKVVNLLYEYVEAGFKSKVIKLDEKKLPISFLGREVDERFIRDILSYEGCPLGESGEYHTYVYDGPLFQKKLGSPL